MCGISGILRFQGVADNQTSTVDKMTGFLSHRGPDDKGIFISNDKLPSIVMGHRRLSILDLSKAGHQPMVDNSGRYCIVYNGEIYNFKELRRVLREKGRSFLSNSDTEVLLYLYIDYGVACISMLEGMFSFAVWDEKERILFVARDRAGEKPFFYYIDKNRFVFASEIKSLLAYSEIDAIPDSSKLIEYLNYRYVTTPYTLFKNIYKLPPASYAYVAKGEITVGSYWNVQPVISQRRKEFREGLASELLLRLKSCVEKRLIADVPVGAFLSGGIDSSAIVAIMSEITDKPVKTFSVGFESPWLSELEYARLVAKTFNTDHHEIVIKASDYINNLENMIWYRDLPVSEPADVPVFKMSRIASEKVKVVLSGEGSDELLGGYYKYFLDPYTKYFRVLPDFIKVSLLKCTEMLPLKYNQIRQTMYTAGMNNYIARAIYWFSSADDFDFSSILCDDFKYEFMYPEGVEEELAFLGYKGSEGMAYLDLKYWLPDNLLERADRMTMANSIELRAPFLDHSFIEFCFSLPSRFKTHGFSTKSLLKESMKGILPEEIINRKKIGFTTPINYWFRDELRSWMEDIIFSNQCRQRGIFDHKNLRKMVDDHVSGVKNNGKAIWVVINFELWHKVFCGNIVRKNINEN